MREGGVRIGHLAFAALAAAGRGRVVSVSPRVVNVVLDGVALVGLLPPGAPLHPWAIVADFAPLRLRAGMCAAVTRGRLGLRLSLGERDRMRLALAKRDIVRLALDGPLRAWPAPAVWAAVRAATDASVEPWGFASGLGPALEHFAASAKPDGLDHLVGRGEGFTPSGDDALVGLLAALASLARLDARVGALRASIVALITPRLDIKTTRLAAQLVAAAAAGFYAEPVLTLFAALSAPCPAGLERLAAAARVVARMGHSSGVALLYGIDAGVRAATACASPTACTRPPRCAGPRPYAGEARRCRRPTGERARGPRRRHRRG